MRKKNNIPFAGRTRWIPSSNASKRIFFYFFPTSFFELCYSMTTPLLWLIEHRVTISRYITHRESPPPSHPCLRNNHSGVSQNVQFGAVLAAPCRPCLHCSIGGHMLRLIDFYFYDSLRYLGGGRGGSHPQTKSADTRANINNKHSIRLSTKSRSLRRQKSKTFSTGSEEG